MQERKLTNRIIWHHSASRDVAADVVRGWHRARGMADIGYHYLVHVDGSVEEGRLPYLVGAHALWRNGDSIGVCLMGDFSRYAPTDKQIEACRILYRRLCARYDKQLVIEFHRTWPNPCPGRLLDRRGFVQFIKDGFRP